MQKAPVNQYFTGTFFFILKAERQGNEPISLCRFNSTIYQYVNALGGTI